MVKSIEISGKSYDMKVSAFTPFAYKDRTGRSLMDDIKTISERKIDESNTLDSVEKIVYPCLDIAYQMILEQNPDFKPYMDWLKELDGLLDNPKWIEDVLVLVMSTFQRQVQINQ